MYIAALSLPTTGNPLLRCLCYTWWLWANVGHMHAAYLTDLNVTRTRRCSLSFHAVVVVAVVVVVVVVGRLHHRQAHQDPPRLHHHHHQV